MLDLEEWLELDSESRNYFARFNSSAKWVGIPDGIESIDERVSQFGSLRQCRLFACACCRRLSRFLVYGDGALNVLEDYADHQAYDRTVQEAVEVVGLVPDLGWPDHEQRIAARAILGILRSAGGEAVHHAAFVYEDPIPERREQYPLLLDVFGQPNPRPKIDPIWLAWGDGTVKALAESIYRERRFEHMPILGDALEDAGCDDRALLDHCRSPGLHVRGCWAVDLLLGHS